MRSFLSDETLESHTCAFTNIHVKIGELERSPAVHAHSHMIVVGIANTHAPCLDLIELPGVSMHMSVHMHQHARAHPHAPTHPKPASDDIHTLLRVYDNALSYRHSDTLYVHVHSVNSHELPEASPVYHTIMQRFAVAHRTVGVLAKCDRFDTHDDTLQTVVESRTHFPPHVAALGCIAVMNKPYHRCVCVCVQLCVRVCLKLSLAPC